MTSSPNPANQMAQMQQMQMAYQQNMMMMQQQMQHMQMSNYQRQGSGNGGGAMGVPPLPMPGLATASNRQPIMTANYMRQVPGVSGDKMSSFSFLGSDPKKEDNKSFDFVKDAMKNG